MIEFDSVIGLIFLGVWLYAIFDAITSPEDQVRNLPKGAWILITILLFEIGAILWFVAGRPRGTGRAGGLPYKGNTGYGDAGRTRTSARGSGSGRAVAPDDDPDFLRQLRASNTEHESMLNQWEADLRRREEDLRRRPGDGEDPTPA